MAKQVSLVKIFITILIILVITGYAIFNSRFLRGGPELVLSSLQDGQIFTEDLATVSGYAKNISFISLNGRQIFIDENGNFKEKLLLTNKINPVKLYAEDRFGKKVYKDITLVYKKG